MAMRVIDLRERDARDAKELEHVERRLLDEFGAVLPADVVHECLAEAAADFDDAKVRQYVALLTERAARRRLSQIVAAGAPARLSITA